MDVRDGLAPLRRLRARAISELLGPPLVRAQGLLHQGRRLVLGGLGRSPRRAPSNLGPPLQANRRLRELMTLYYMQGRYAPGAQPVAWITSGAPVELLRALGYYVVYPENHAALAGARHRGAALSAVAEQAGYSQELCSYARIDLGSLLSGDSPVGQVPRPDLLVACTNICQTAAYWFRILSQLTGAPLVVLDTPFVHGQVRQHARLYVRDQLQQLAGLAEQRAHLRLDEQRLRQVVADSRQAILLWRDALAQARHRPAPWSALDMFVMMAPIVTLRGEPSAIRFYEALRSELRRRVEVGQGALRREKVRLLWDNLPVWFRLRRLSELLSGHDATLVGATYTHAWADGVDLLDPEQPWQSLADVYLRVHLNRDLESRYQLMARLAAEHAADGVILHANRSCKSYTIGQQDIAERLQQEHGLRCLILEADHADERAWSDEATELRLEAFLESFG